MWRMHNLQFIDFYGFEHDVLVKENDGNYNMSLSFLSSHQDFVIANYEVTLSKDECTL